MGVVSKYITLDEIEILRAPLEKLHAHHNSRSTYFSGTYPRMTFEERLETYRQNAKHGEYRIEVLFTSDANTVIGYCIISREAAHGKLDVLFVEESYRGQKLGAMLVNSALDWFKTNNIKEIDLSVVQGNEVVAFYQKMGFFPRSLIMTKSL
jgi:GNAT superfamily N-acetyltransferase